MTAEDWTRATFAGTELAQARVMAELSPDERLSLLEDLLEIAEASGALRRAREEKQALIDALWDGLSPQP